jgi:hypothetical protein
VPLNTTNDGTGQEGKYEKYENKFMMIGLSVDRKMGMSERSTYQLKKAGDVFGNRHLPRLMLNRSFSYLMTRSPK